MVFVIYTIYFSKLKNWMLYNTGDSTWERNKEEDDDEEHFLVSLLQLYCFQDGSFGVLSTLYFSMGHSQRFVLALPASMHPRLGTTLPSGYIFAVRQATMNHPRSSWCWMHTWDNWILFYSNLFYHLAAPPLNLYWSCSIYLF